MTDLVSRARIGFGVLRSASPGAAALRGGKRAADHSRRTHSAAPGAAPGRRTAFFRDTQFIEESGPPQRLPLALGCDGEGFIRRQLSSYSGFCTGNVHVRQLLILGTHPGRTQGILGSIAMLTHKVASPCATKHQGGRALRSMRNDGGTSEQWSS